MNKDRDKQRLEKLWRRSGASSSTLDLDAVDDRVAELLKEGDNISIHYNDSANTLTITADVVTPVTTSVVVTVPNPGRLQHTETVSFVGCVPEMNVFPSVAPATDADENGAEGLFITAMSALAGTNLVTLVMSFGERTSGPIKLNLMAIPT